MYIGSSIPEVLGKQAENLVAEDGSIRLNIRRSEVLGGLDTVKDAKELILDKIDEN